MARPSRVEMKFQYCLHRRTPTQIAKTRRIRYYRQRVFYLQTEPTRAKALLVLATSRLATVSEFYLKYEQREQEIH